MNSISVIGGDLRIVELVKILKQNVCDDIFLFGLENSKELQTIERVKNCNSLKEAIDKSEKIITSIPLSKDGNIVNSIYSNNTIYVDELFEISKNKKIFTGNITEEISKKINFENNNEIIDVLKFEELSILNAIPTAEGAIQIAMEKSKNTLNGSNCLVMGFGRIGKILSKMLLGLGANVYCEARKKEDIAFIKAFGYNAIDLKNLNSYLNMFDFIFNTIPFIILDESNLKQVEKECIIIDLASKPGGVDFKYANKIGLQTEWALALPRKSCT